MRRSAVTAPLCSSALAGVVALGVSLCGGASGARAQDSLELRDIAAVQRACRDATGPGERELYSVAVPREQWRFGGMQLNEVANSDATGVTMAESGTVAHSCTRCSSCGWAHSPRTLESALA